MNGDSPATRAPKFESVVSKPRDQTLTATLASRPCGPPVASYNPAAETALSVTERSWGVCLPQLTRQTLDPFLGEVQC